MRHKLRWAAAAVAVLAAGGAAGAAIAVGSAPVPARAAAGWRIERVFAGPDAPIQWAFAASGADNAWLLEVPSVPGGPDFVTQRWNGSRWVPVALPARLPGSGPPTSQVSGIYTTSPDDTWFFPALGGVQYALQWDGSAWTISRITAGPDTVVGAAVFSSTDVWALGQAISSALLAWHWNGRAWQAVPAPPAMPVSVDGVAPDNIWALGAPFPDPPVSQDIIVMHWNGTAWSVPSVPAVPPVRAGYPWVAAGITAAGPRDAWVALTPHESPAAEPGPGEGGLILLHWNGSTWRAVAETRALGVVTGLTPDGHGGFWLTTTDPANDEAGDIVDYRDGTVTSQPVPAPPGYTGTASDIVAVPGTGSFWAAGTMREDNGDNYETDILQYTP
jgi:hypothetical protein